MVEIPYVWAAMRQAADGRINDHSEFSVETRNKALRIGDLNRFYQPQFALDLLMVSDSV